MKIKVFLSLVLLLFLSVSIFGQAPTRWRGPLANGIYPDKGLMKSWPAEGPEVLWTFNDLGQGYSSPVFNKDNIYVSGMLEDIGYILKLTLKGELVWKVTYGNEFKESFPGSRSSPVIAGDRLYILSATGKLVCMNTADGKLVWRKDLFKDFDGRQIQWGLVETVVIDGDKLYCTPGGVKNNVIALNRNTGNLIWSCPGMGDKAAYCTPLLVDIGTRKVLINLTAANIIGIDAGTGKMLWNYGQIDKFAMLANTPLYFDKGLFCFSGYDVGGVKLSLTPDGSAVTKDWVNKSMDCRMGGVVLVNGFIYGSGDRNSAWQCIDWKTGEQKYTSKEIPKGNIIYADGMLYCYTEKGDLALVDATPSAFKIVSKIKVTAGSDEHWAHTVINKGILYVRHGKSLIAYKIK